jgi:hypothetical protein
MATPRFTYRFQCESARHTRQLTLNEDVPPTASHVLAALRRRHEGARLQASKRARDDVWHLYDPTTRTLLSADHAARLRPNTSLVVVRLPAGLGAPAYPRVLAVTAPAALVTKRARSTSPEEELPAKRARVSVTLVT